MLDRPLRVLCHGDLLASASLDVAPRPKATDHVVAHAGRECESPRRPPTCRGTVYICGVGDGDWRERFVVLQSCCELLVELADLVVGGLAQGGKRINGRTHRCGSNSVFRLRDVQQVAILVNNHQPVALTERFGDLNGNGGDTVAAEHHSLAGNQRLQLLIHRASISWIVTGRPSSIER